MKMLKEQFYKAMGWSVWEIGTCRDKPARKHMFNGNVQFVLWKAGQQGHKMDYWHNYDPSWWDLFEPSKEKKFHNYD